MEEITGGQEQAEPAFALRRFGAVRLATYPRSPEAVSTLRFDKLQGILAKANNGRLEL